MTVVMELMNPQNIASLKEGHVSAICLLATTATAFRAFTFAMETMIAWTTATKITDISAVRVLKV